MPQVGSEDFVLDVSRVDPAVDERAADRLHQRQRPAQVVSGVGGQADGGDVHHSGEPAVYLEGALGALSGPDVDLAVGQRADVVEPLPAQREGLLVRVGVQHDDV